MAETHLNRLGEVTESDGIKVELVTKWSIPDYSCHFLPVYTAFYRLFCASSGFIQGQE